MKTVYLALLDEAAMRERLQLEPTEAWDGELPFGQISDDIRTDRFSNCSQLQARGSLACYAVMEGLQNPLEFADGVLLPGMQYIPIAAFHERMYPAVMDRLSETLAEYDLVVSRVFEFDVIRGAKGLIGQFRVECYGEDMSWCGRGHWGYDTFAWKVGRQDPQLEEAGVEDAPEDAPRPRVPKKTRKAK